MEAKTNRRRYGRLQSDDKLFVQVLAASESSWLVGETLQCSALDVSASGVRVQVACEVAVHSEIDLWIEAQACAQKFFMHGLVKWCYEVDAEHNIYQLGVELLNVPFTDFEEWRAILDDNEAGERLDQTS